MVDKVVDPATTERTVEQPIERTSLVRRFAVPLWARDLVTLRRLPWRGVILQAAGMWLATRIAFALVTYFTLTFAPQAHAHPSSPQAMLLAWQRKDVFWYLHIAQYGYWLPSPATFVRDGGQMPTAFFPLYPMLIRAATFLLGGGNWLAAAMLVSNLSMLGAFIGLGLLAAHEDGTPAAPLAMLVAAANPLAFFATAAYTEGLFFACAALGLFFARRGAWRWAALCGFLAGLTRFTGVVMILPLLWEYARQHGWHKAGARAVARRWRELLEAGVVAGAAGLAILCYAAYLWARFGDPLSFVHAAQQNWGHLNTPPWVSLPRAATIFATTPLWSFWQARLLFDFAPILIFGLVTLVSARRVPVAFTLYMLGLIYLSIASPVNWSRDIYVSAGRYLLPSVPAYLVLGRWARDRRWLEMLLVSGGFVLQGLFTALWLTNGVGFI